ncbi:amino acid ABC transporter permease [Ancylobacter sp. Lp-2]|uniref:amino acid ABC transporter permease n=1 Tax=Ancylobacter sp. Lp-2 TaxID=2881339 RepID=UPI001E556F1D|nr:amino acid ABC transporter permease [Ancylobacter sp. Lp-2]MCB4769665.1 amino acid ABC transporter permease [Ancylobacter sp. Lp-2]
MGGYTWDFSAITRNWDQLMDGLAVTLQLTGICTVIGLVGGFLVCLMAMSRLAPLRWIAVAFIELFRCTPALVQIIWIFYCVPFFFGVFFDPFLMAVLALGMNITAFNAEAYRAAIQAIPSSHEDACTALGLSPLKKTVYVILPQALLMATPVLLTNTIGLLQQTSLVAIVAIADLMYQGKTLATQTYRPIEIYTAVAFIYFAFSLPLSQVVGLWERRLRSRLA